MPSFSQLLAQHPVVLLIDAASARIQAGLWQRGEVRWQTSDREAGSGLFTCVEHLLAGSGLRIEAVNAFIFCEGPGSVLGIRTTAVALRTWRVLNPDSVVYSYQSLALLVHANASSSGGGTLSNLRVIADARRETWHVASPGQPLRRIAAAEINAGATGTGPLLMPEGFRHWSPLPAGVVTTPYDLAKLLTLPAVAHASDLFKPCAEPDAFLHEEPSYLTWTPQIHQAPAKPATSA